MSNRATRPSCLITGASAGIGYELARVFAEKGYDEILIARQQPALSRVAERLSAEYGISVTVIPADLAHPDSAREIHNEVKRRGLRVDILVQNAGFGVFGPFAETSLKDEMDMIQVHIASLTVLTKLVLHDMLARKSGRILNVASTAAFQPGPGMAIYYATKAYLLSFSEAISNELQRTGVTVSVLCPGPTRTGFQEKAGMEHAIVAKVGMMDAATVARAGYNGMMRGRAVIVPGLVNNLLVFAVRFVPRSVVRWCVRRLH